MLEQIVQWLFPQLYSDISLLILALKLVILLFIISFVRTRFGAGPITTVLVAVLAYLILFKYWVFTGPLALIYLFITFGFVSLLFDLAIAKPWRKLPTEGPDVTSKDKAEQMARIRAMMR